MRRKIATIAAIFLFTGFIFGTAPTPASAQSALSATFEDALYGGLTGALVGGAVLVFQDEPEDHLIYIAYGAAIGVIAGTVYGVVNATRAFAEVEGGSVRFGMPMVIPALAPGHDGSVALAVHADLFRARF